MCFFINDVAWPTSGPRDRAHCDRMATVFFYLNDVDDGGETAFCYRTEDGGPRGVSGIHQTDTGSGKKGGGLVIFRVVFLCFVFPVCHSW